jgi:hypothetical protein
MNDIWTFICENENLINSTFLLWRVGRDKSYYILKYYILHAGRYSSEKLGWSCGGE